MKEDKVCTICKGTGFVKGKLCSCITGEKKRKNYGELPEGWAEMFGDLLNTPRDKK